MKHNIFKGLLVCGAALALAGCSENSWNEENLDGFEAPSLNTPTRTYIDYTLTATDYKKIAGMAANVAKAKEAGVLAELTAVGTNGYFSDVITPREYLGAWLDSIANTPGSPFKSSLAFATARISYESASEMPEPVVGINAAQSYVVTTADYMAAYGAADENGNYAEAFSPAHPASATLPGLLKTQFPSAAKGAYAYVTYNQSATNPVWGGNGGGGTTEPEKPSFELGKVALNDVVTDAKLQVTAIAKNGVILSDKTGSIFAYLGSGHTVTTLGMEVTVSGTVSANNNGLQFNKPTITEGTAKKFTYPTPKTYTASEWDAKKAEYQAMFNASTGTGAGLLPSYVKVSGPLTVSGSYYNVQVDGTSTATASLSNLFDDAKALMTNGETVTIEGYLISSGASYMNVVVTSVNGKALFAMPAAAPARRVASRGAADIAYETVNAVYNYNGSAWSVPADVYVVTDADYKQMGITNATLSYTQVKNYLPTLLSKEFPYAADGTVKYVVYNKEHKAERLIYNAALATWVLATKTATCQFVRTKEKTWMFDPTVYLYYPADSKNADSKAFYNASVQWVWDNINVSKLGVQADIFNNWPVEKDAAGKTIMQNFGYCWGTTACTQEGYSGMSAYYCNYDSRPYTVRKNLTPENFEAFYGGMSDEDIQALLQKRFCEEVAPGALGMLFPDADVRADGIDQDYEVTLVQYNPTTHNVTFRFRVVAKGKFKFLECADWGLTGK